MKVNWTYALWILLFVFGILYTIGTFFGNFSGEIRTWIEPSTDLWANLFASMIAIVVIERVITRVRLERNQQSITFVRGRIASALDNLIVSVRVPSDWKNKFKDPKYDWESYYKKLGDSRDIALTELETILDRYNYLLDSKLKNDIILLINALRIYYDYHIKFPQRGWNLVDATAFSGLFISESKKILEKHNLLKAMKPDMSFRTGEPPQKFFSGMGLSEKIRTEYFSQLLEEAISFRDECREKYLRN